MRLGIPEVKEILYIEDVELNNVSELDKVITLESIDINEISPSITQSIQSITEVMELIDTLKTVGLVDASIKHMHSKELLTIDIDLATMEHAEVIVKLEEYVNTSIESLSDSVKKDITEKLNTQRKRVDSIISRSKDMLRSIATVDKFAIPVWKKDFSVEYPSADPGSVLRALQSNLYAMDTLLKHIQTGKFKSNTVFNKYFDTRYLSAAKNYLRATWDFKKTKGESSSKSIDILKSYHRMIVDLSKAFERHLKLFESIKDANFDIKTAFFSKNKPGAQQVVIAALYDLTLMLQHFEMRLTADEKIIKQVIDEK